MGTGPPPLTLCRPPPTAARAPQEVCCKDKQNAGFLSSPCSFLLAGRKESRKNRRQYGWLPSQEPPLAKEIKFCLFSHTQGHLLSKPQETPHPCKRHGGPWGAFVPPAHSIPAI